MHRNESSEFLGAIRVSGADSETFLQGQLTQDMRQVTADPALAGYCSPKGRLLAVMEARRFADGFVLQMHRSVLDPTLKRLRMFVLRSKVALDPVAPAEFDGDENAWRLTGIRAGIPVVYPETSDRFVPQMVNLDRLGGIGFEKGCYTGQEIVARLHYLGNLKRRMFHMTSASSAQPGTPVFEASGETQAAGEVVDCANSGNGWEMSVVLQLSHAQSNKLRLGSADGPAVILNSPPPLAGEG